MNSLSWFLYFADAIASFSVMLLFVSIVLLLFLSIYAISRLVDHKDSSYFKWIALPVFMLFLFTLIPSKNTMYAIAASELGEEVVKSEIGKKSLKAIEQWIDSQINKK